MEPDWNDSGLFPMPLTSMERFHWFDSTSQFTNQIYCRCRFRGVVDPIAAQQAMTRVVARHPLLTAKIKTKSGRLVWCQEPEAIPVIDWNETIDPSAGPRPIDLGGDLPWNIVCRNDGDSTEIWLYVSHVVCDGLAGIQLISEWMRYYHCMVAGASDKRIHKLSAPALTKRNSLGLLKSSYLKQLWKQPIALFGASKFIFRRPAEFLPGKTVSRDWDFDQQPAVTGVWLDKEFANTIKVAATRHSVSTNTLLVGALMKTLEECCQNQTVRNSKWIRIILPMSIRTFADRRMTATNRATIVQVDRCAKDFKKVDFLKGLDREIKIIRKWELGKLFLIFIRGMSAIPGAIKAAASNSKCRGTAVFANLADPFGRIGLPVVNDELVVGNLKLKDFDFVGPIRNLMPVNFSAQRHLGRLRISLHFDSRVINDQEAADILVRLRLNMEALLESLD